MRDSTVFTGRSGQPIAITKMFYRNDKKELTIKWTRNENFYSLIFYLVKRYQNIVSTISQCESHALSENSAWHFPY